MQKARASSIIHVYSNRFPEHMTTLVHRTSFLMKGTFLAGFFLSLLIILSGCGNHQPPEPSDDPLAIPFDLVLPANLSGGDYYAIAGIKSEEQVSQIQDSLEEVTVRRFYAEFLPANSSDSVNFDVYINTTKLKRHRDGDTLRLQSAFDTSVTNGDQIWHLREPGETRFDIGRFILPAVSLLDTISPFQGLRDRNGTIRSDTALTIGWKPGATGGNMRIEWRGPNNTVIRDALDFAGNYTIPAEVLANLRGPGTVIITRFQSQTEDFNGKTIVAMRLAQRTYEVTVQ